MSVKQILSMIAIALVVNWGAPRARALPSLLASFTASPQAWNAAFETNPTNTDAISQADDHIRQIKEEVRQRVETEMDFGEIGNVTTDTGRLLEGGARAFRQNTAPTVDGSITAACLAEADWDGNRGCDDGRLFVDADGPDNTGSTADDNTLYTAVDSDSDGDADSWAAVPATLPTNSIILWDSSNTCPPGFSEATEFRNHTIRGADRLSANGNIPDGAGVSCNGGTLGAGCSAAGGTDNYDDAISTDELPAHTHTVPTGNTGGTGDDAFLERTSNTSTSTQVSSSTGGAEHHLHPLRTVMFCRKS